MALRSRSAASSNSNTQSAFGLAMGRRSFDGSGHDASRRYTISHQAAWAQERFQHLPKTLVEKTVEEEVAGEVQADEDGHGHLELSVEV